MLRPWHDGRMNRAPLPRIPLLLAIVLLVSLPAWAVELTGRVVGLSDGDTVTILTAERRQVRVRLWALPEAERTPPWEWRAAERGEGSRQASTAPPATSPQRSAPTASSGFTCGGKRYCREMTSCAEARFYFSQCGLSRLDGDRDGVPCETLCR